MGIQILLPELIDEFETDPNHFLRNYLEINDLINWAPQSLTYLFHALADELIPFENAQIWVILTKSIRSAIHRANAIQDGYRLC